MSNFNNYSKFENVGINSSNDRLIIMNSSDNNISLHSSDGTENSIDTLSIKNIINKTPNMDLNLSSLNGTTVNPVITINNNNQDCRIMTNLNVNENLNINKNLNVNGHINSTNIDVDKLSIRGEEGASNYYIKSQGSSIATWSQVDYSHITNTPFIPTQISHLNNDSGYQNRNGSVSYSDSTGSVSWSNISGTKYASDLYNNSGWITSSSLSSLSSVSGDLTIGGKLNFPLRDASSGGGYLVQPSTDHCQWQSGSHWGSGVFSISTNRGYGSWAYLYFYTHGGNKYIRSYNKIQASGGVSNSSDDRLKTDEKIITGEKGKEIIMKLRPQTYNKYEELNDTYDGPKLDSGKQKEAGFIAQDIFFEIPEIRFILSGLTKDGKDLEEVNIDEIDFNKVREDPDYSIFGKDILGVDYGEIIPYLTAHNQEKQKEIDTLKTKNQEQQKEIDILKIENAELKSIINKLKTANSFEEFKSKL